MLLEYVQWQYITNSAVGGKKLYTNIKASTETSF